MAALAASTGRVISANVVTIVPGERIFRVPGFILFVELESAMARALWNGKVIAESETTETVEGNVYFPESSLKREYFRPSTTTSTCPWKGQARYLSLLIDGNENPDAAWYYPDPKPAARKIKGFVAFWRGVEVEK